MRYTYKYVEEEGYIIKDNGHTLFAEDVRKKLNRLEFLEQKLVEQRNKNELKI